MGRVVYWLLRPARYMRLRRARKRRYAAFLVRAVRQLGRAIVLAGNEYVKADFGQISYWLREMNELRTMRARITQSVEWKWQYLSES